MYPNRYPRLSRALAVALSGPVLVTSPLASTIDVPVDYATISEAVSASAPGDEIVVAPGVYDEPYTVVSHAITIRASFGPEHTIVKPVPFTSVMFSVESSVDGLFRLEGFTFRETEAPVVFMLPAENATIQIVGNWFLENGGFALLSLEGGHHEVTGNRFEDSTLIEGGHEVAITGPGRIAGNVIVGNGTPGGVFELHPGDGGTMEVVGNEIISHGVNRYGSVITFGAGMIVVAENTFTDGAGGLFMQRNGGRQVVRDNLFVRTPSPIYARLAGADVYRNTIVDTPSGPGIYAGNGSAVHVHGNLVVGGAGPGIEVEDGATSRVQCNITFDNAGGPLVGHGSLVSGNADVDPLFCDRAGGDYGVEPISPCLPENNPCLEPVGAFGEACAVTPTATSSWGRIKARYRAGL